MRKRAAGFTLTELVTVIAIIGLLALLLMPAAARIKLYSQRVRCMSNLRSLHVAASQYLQEYQSWPQITMSSNSEADYTAKWIAIFQPFGITAKTWTCPSIQRDAVNETPSGSIPQRDYAAGTFGTGRMTPFKWSTQPWFFELANVHGKGNLIVFPDGSVKALDDI